MKLSFKILFVVCIEFAATMTFAREININMMWINRKIDSNNQYVFPDIREKGERQLNARTLERLAKTGAFYDVRWNQFDIRIIEDWMIPWLSNNPNKNFVFWYDSRAVSEQQIETTNARFAELQKEFLVAGGSLSLRDIRDLKMVRENELIFSEAVPIYLRVDLLRMIVGLEYLEKCPGQCAYLYLDADKGLKKPSSSINHFATTVNAEEALSSINENARKINSAYFDNNVGTLEEYGLALNGNSIENSALVMTNDNPNMLKAIRSVVVLSNFERIKMWLARDKELREQLPPSMKSVDPKKFAAMDDFKLLSIDDKKAWKVHFERGVSMIWWSFTNSPLLTYFLFLEGKLDLQFHGKKLGDDESTVAKMFASLDLGDDYDDYVQDIHESTKNTHMKCTVIEDPTKKCIDVFVPYKMFPRMTMDGSETASAQLGWQL